MQLTHICFSLKALIKIGFNDYATAEQKTLVHEFLLEILQQSSSEENVGDIIYLISLVSDEQISCHMHSEALKRVLKHLNRRMIHAKAFQKLMLPILS